MKHHRVDQNSDVWLSLRAGIPTGSRASDLITSAGEPSKSIPRYAEELAMNRFAGKSITSFHGNKSTERGHELEQEAADWYAFETDSEPELCGFFTDDLKRYGASPDRTIGDKGLMEIKCQEAAGHLKTLLKYHRDGKTPASYYPQIQMELMTTEREWLDVVLYHPDLPSTIIRVLPDLKFHAALKLQITACIKHRDEVVKQLEKIAA